MSGIDKGMANGCAGEPSSMRGHWCMMQVRTEKTCEYVVILYLGSESVHPSLRQENEKKK